MEVIFNLKCNINYIFPKCIVKLKLLNEMSFFLVSRKNCVKLTKHFFFFKYRVINIMCYSLKG